MSKMIPDSMVRILRSYNDFSVKLSGIDCHLYVVQNNETVEIRDVYAAPSDLNFKEYDTQVKINWNPNKYQLQKYGLYAEDGGIIAYFPNKLVDESGFEYTTEIPKNSWFTIITEFPELKYGTNNFDIVDVLVDKMHDAAVIRAYKIAPHRNKI
jgi:hypothetical protein